MKAIAVHPGTPNSMHLREVERPSVSDIPGGRGVLVQVLRVGVDGTEEEINAAAYGEVPPGHDYLITGHDNFERGINLRHGYLTEYYVEDAGCVVPLPDALEEVGVLLGPMTVGEKGSQAYEIQRRLRVWQPRRALVLGAGTIGLLTALAKRLRGLEVTCVSLRNPPYRNSDLIEELGATYLSSQDVTLAGVAAARGPFDLILDATGFSPLVFEVAQVLGKNGVLVLVDDMIAAEALYPGWLGKLLTHPIRGLENYREMLAALTDGREAIKVYVEVGA